MELFFLALLVLIMAGALGSGYPVAFALPGSAIITIGLAAGAGYLFDGNTDAYFHSGGPQTDIHHDVGDRLHEAHPVPGLPCLRICSRL